MSYKSVCLRMTATTFTLQAEVGEACCVWAGWKRESGLRQSQLLCVGGSGGWMMAKTIKLAVICIWYTLTYICLPTSAPAHVCHWRAVDRSFTLESDKNYNVNNHAKKKCISAKKKKQKKPKPDLQCERSLRASSWYKHMLTYLNCLSVAGPCWWFQRTILWGWRT